MLRLHHAIGLSAAVSAQLIGAVSRNAVISKRRRLGLIGANPLQAAIRFVRRASLACEPLSYPSLGRFSRVPPARAESSIRREPLPLMEQPAPPNADPKTLAHRSRGECAWPLGPAEAPGDYRTLFCCAPVGPGRTYCPAHRARAFTGQVLPPLRVRSPAAMATDENRRDRNPGERR